MNEDDKPFIRMAEPGEHSLSLDPIAFPPTKWTWDVFGGGELIVLMSRDISWLFRLRSRILMGSKWKKEDKA